MKRPNGISIFNLTTFNIDQILKVWSCIRGCTEVKDCNGSCKNFIMIVLLFCSFNIFAQQGMKGMYNSSKPVTEESLTKGSVIFDTFVDGGNIYYKKKQKKDGSQEDYYYIVVQKTRKSGEKYLGTKRVYPEFTNK